MTPLPADEQAELDEAWSDGTEWIVNTGMPNGVKARLQGKGLIKLNGHSWQLTPLGRERRAKL